MGGLNETIMEAEPLLSLPMGPVRTLGDNRVGWIPNCEDAAPPRCAPVCKATCCAFCAFCAVRYSNSARASGGTCSACYAFCACYLVCTCCTRCARSTRFQNLTCNTVGHKSAPPARNVQMVAKGIFSVHNMQKWITFDISDGTSSKNASYGLLLCSYGALLCVQFVLGLESHEYLQGGG